MTEIAVNPAAALAPTGGGLAALPQTTAVIQLQEWAAELSAAHQIATALALSNFLPKALREKSNKVVKTPEEITADAAAVILAGKSVGLDPLQSVQNIFPVHGMPSMYARTMGALVMARGHEVRRTAATNESVTYMVRRKGETDWQDFTWTIERAAKAGYLSNAKYESDPIAMLGAKALSEACRTVFPDILLGMAYSAEELELEDMGEVSPPAAVAAPKATRPTITRKSRTDPAPSPASAPAAGPVTPVDTSTGEIQDAAPIANVNYFEAIQALGNDAAGLRALYGQASTDGQPQNVLDAIATAGAAAKAA